MKPQQGGSSSRAADRAAHLEWKAVDICKQRGKEAAKHYLTRHGASKEMCSRVLEGK